MSDAAEWNLVVSRRTDDAVREFLASEPPGQGDALSLFVEEAVQARLFDLTVANLRQQNAHLSADEIMDAVDEALEWVRRR